MPSAIETAAVAISVLMNFTFFLPLRRFSGPMRALLPRGGARHDNVTMDHHPNTRGMRSGHELTLLSCYYNLMILSSDARRTVGPAAFSRFGRRSRQGDEGLNLDA